MTASPQVETEDDVLFVDKMPDFGGRVSGQDAEVLASYLIAPYLRIPLLLNFFADEARIHSLDSLDLQVTALRAPRRVYHGRALLLCACSRDVAADTRRPPPPVRRGRVVLCGSV